MVIINAESSEFRWIGASYRKDCCEHYRSFYLGEEIFQVDDFVLVRNDLALDPEDVSQCYVAQVKDLYETGIEPMPHVAKVQWYSRLFEIPVKFLKDLGNADSQYEIVEEGRKMYPNTVDAETIFSRCQVLFLPVDTNFELLTPKFENNDVPTFYCRYKFNSKKLVPLMNLEAGCISEPENIYSEPRYVRESRPIIEKIRPINGWKSVDSTPTKEKELYCATPSGTLLHPKVLIRKLDKRVLENKNNGARILIADSKTESVESITAKFMNGISLNSHPNTPNHTEKPCKNNVMNNCLKSPSKLPKLNGIVSTPKSKKGKVETPSSKKQTRSRRETTSVSKDILEPVEKSSKLYTPKKELKFNGTYSNKLCTPKKELKTVQKPSSKLFTPNKKKKDESPGPSPKKIFKASINDDFLGNDYNVTRSGRKVKSVNYYEEKREHSAFASPKLSDKFSKLLSLDDADSDEDNFRPIDYSSSDDSITDSVPIDKKKSRSRQSVKRPSVKKKDKNLNIPERKTPLKTPQNVLEESRQRLHVSAVPKSLPCREEEYSDIYTFVKGCLCAQTGGCMYISGVPGTGKTATVHEVVRNLEEEKETGEIPMFSFVEVNGMWMTDPYQCYVHIFKSLTGKTIAPQQAASLLEKHFTEPGPKKDAVILLVDELDRLWTRKQTVMYNIFDWPTKKHSKLIVLAIANTMDLPERMMMNRIASRLGLTRKTFQPYNFRQLQEIIMTRIQELKVFDPDAVQLVARKVAAVSGDARRALDICRFATEVTKVKVSKSSRKGQTTLVGMQDVDLALQQMFSSPLISAIKSSSVMAKIFFRCILSEFSRTGSEETTLLKVYQQMTATCRFEGLSAPTSSEVSSICGQLAASHLILVDNFRNDLHLKIRLNVSSDDVNYALTGR